MRRSTRLLIAAVVIAGIAVGGGFGLKALWDNATSNSPYNHCTISGYELDPDQASVAATMAGAVTSFTPALPERALVLVLAAGLQESKLRNLPPGAGDQDSVGVLQQRPSQGWGGGNAAKLNDVGEATREFLAALIKLPDWRTGPLAKVVQDVQISADGSLYAQHEPEAQALSDALAGVKPAAITCTLEAPTEVATPTRVSELVSGDLPIRKPTTTTDSVRVGGAHWQTAAWFVAYSYQLGIEQVSYDHKTWTRKHGWKTSSAPSTAVVATMFHKTG